MADWSILLLFVFTLMNNKRISVIWGPATVNKTTEVRKWIGGYEGQRAVIWEPVGHVFITPSDSPHTWAWNFGPSKVTAEDCNN